MVRRVDANNVLGVAETVGSAIELGAAFRRHSRAARVLSKRRRAPAVLLVVILAYGEHATAAAGHGLLNIGAHRRRCARRVGQRVVRQTGFTLEKLVELFERLGVHCNEARKGKDQVTEHCYLCKIKK